MACPTKITCPVAPMASEGGFLLMAEPDGLLLRETQSFASFSVSFFAAQDLRVYLDGDTWTMTDHPVCVAWTNTCDVPLTLALSAPSGLIPDRFSEAASLTESLDLSDASGATTEEPLPQNQQYDLEPGAVWTSPPLLKPLLPVLGQMVEGVSLQGGHPVRPAARREIQLTFCLRAVVVSATRVHPIDTSFSTDMTVFSRMLEN